MSRGFRTVSSQTVCLVEDLNVVQGCFGFPSRLAAKTEHQVQGRLLLDVVILQGAVVLQLFASEDKALLIRRNALFILNLLLNSLDVVGGLNAKGNRLSRQGLNEYLHR